MCRHHAQLSCSSDFEKIKLNNGTRKSTSISHRKLLNILLEMCIKLCNSTYTFWEKKYNFPHYIHQVVKCSEELNIFFEKIY